MEEKKRNMTAYRYSQGCVYAVEFGNVIKIGFTTDFEQRIKSLKGSLRYRNERMKIGKTYCSKEMHYVTRAESLLHEKFKDKRIEHTELFRITFEEAVEAIKKVEQLKLYSDEEWNQKQEDDRASEIMWDTLNELGERAKEAEEERKEHAKVVDEYVKVTGELLKAYEKQIEQLKECQWITTRMFFGLCNDEGYRDWLLNNPSFIEHINDEYGKMATKRLLKKSSTD